MWSTHAEEVTTYLVDFLLRQAASQSSTPHTVIPLDLNYALSMAAQLGQNDGILRRNPRDPESYSLLTSEHKAAKAAHIEMLRKAASECRLRIPGAKDKETWEQEADPATVRPKRRWR